MVKKVIIPVGDQLFIKVDVKSPWEPAKLSDLKALLSDRETPYSSQEKLKLSQFAYGRKDGDKGNKQLFPTKMIVLELDTPSPDKGDLNKEEIFKKWSTTFMSIYNMALKDENLPFKIMYLTPSRCGLRFVIKLESPVNDEDEYKSAVLAYFQILERYGAIEDYLDIKVNCGWFVPTFKEFYSFRQGTFDYQSSKARNNLKKLINKAIRLTEESKNFEDGNRNNFIYHLGRNANRLGIEKQDLLDYISESDFAYDTKEINTTVDSAYKKKEDFGIWKDKSDIDNTTQTLMSLFKRAKNMEPIPIIWSGIKEGSLGFVFGPSKSGKSTLCECLAMSLETGIDNFLGLPLTGKKYKILYISMEEYWEQRVERNKQQRSFLFKTFNKKLGSNYFTNNEKFPTHILNDADLRFIEIEINKNEPDIVFIDSFTRLILDKVEDSSRTNIMMQKLKQMCNDTGATFVLIHHTTKAKDKSLGILNMAGSRVLSQEADFLIGVNRTPNEQRYLKDVAFRYAPERDKVTPFKINDSRWVVPEAPAYEAELVEKTDGRKDDSNKQAIFEYIKTSERPVSAAEIKDLFGEGVISKKTVFNNLNKLLEEGKIQKVEKGLYQCSVDNKE